MIKRLLKSLKYECVYLRELETGSELRSALAWPRQAAELVKLSTLKTLFSGPTKWTHF